MPEDSAHPTEYPVLLRPPLANCQVLPPMVRQYLKIRTDQGRLAGDRVAKSLKPIFDRHPYLLEAQSDFSFHRVPAFWTAAFLGSAVAIVLAILYLPDRPAQNMEMEEFLVLSYISGMAAASFIASFLHIGESFWVGWRVDVELGMATGLFVLPCTNILFQVFSSDLPLIEAILKGIAMGLIGAVTFGPFMALSGGSQMGGVPGRLLAKTIKAFLWIEDVEEKIKEAVKPFGTTIRKTIEDQNLPPNSPQSGEENNDPPQPG